MTEIETKNIVNSINIVIDYIHNTIVLSPNHKCTMLDDLTTIKNIIINERNNNNV